MSMTLFGFSKTSNDWFLWFSCCVWFTWIQNLNKRIMGNVFTCTCWTFLSPPFCCNYGPKQTLQSMNTRCLCLCHTTFTYLLFIHNRDGGLEDRPRSRGRPRDLILMASVSVLVSAAHVSVSVLVSEVLALSTGFRELALVSRAALRPSFDGLGLGLGLCCRCLCLGLGGPGLAYNPDPLWQWLFVYVWCIQHDFWRLAIALPNKRHLLFSKFIQVSNIW